MICFQKLTKSKQELRKISKSASNFDIFEPYDKSSRKKCFGGYRYQHPTNPLRSYVLLRIADLAHRRVAVLLREFPGVAVADFRGALLEGGVDVAQVRVPRMFHSKT